MNLNDGPSPGETPNPEGNRPRRPGKGRKPQRWTQEQLEKAFARRNPILSEVNGRFAGFNLRTDKNGQIHVRKPQRRPWLTDTQRAIQARFKDAAAYMRKALADPGKRLRYEAVAALKGIPASSLA